MCLIHTSTFIAATRLTEVATETEEDVIDFYGKDNSDGEQGRADTDEPANNAQEAVHDEAPQTPKKHKYRLPKTSFLTDTSATSFRASDTSGEYFSPTRRRDLNTSRQVDPFVVDLLICFECRRQTGLPDVYWADKTTTFTCNECFKRNSNHSECTAAGCQVMCFVLIGVKP